MTTHVGGKPVSISECVTIAKTLDRLLSPSFGPNALHNLLCTATGKLLITSNGRSLLQSLHLSHPVGRLLVGAAVTMHNLTGDNTKTFIAVVTDALCQVEKCIGVGGFESHGETHERLMMANALCEVKRQVFPALEADLVRVYASGTSMGYAGREQTLQLCGDVIWTSLQGRFNAETRQKLVALSSELLSECCLRLDDLPDVLQFIVDEFNIVCVDSPGQSVFNSCVLDGVVIQRCFQPGCRPVLPMHDVTFVMLNLSLESACPTESSVRIELTSQQQSRDSLQLNSIRTQRFIAMLKLHGVRLVITPELVSQSTALVFAQSSVFIVHSVDKEEIKHLCNLTKVHVICDDSDLISPGSGAIFGHAPRVDTIAAGGRDFVLVQLPERTTSGAFHVQHSIRLCGPTPGTCDQFAAAVLCGFKSAKLAVHPSPYTGIGTVSDGIRNVNHLGVVTDERHHQDSQGTIWVCPGGGAFEMLAHDLLKKHAAHHPQSVTLSLTCDILAKALLSVPTRLLQKSFHPQAKLHQLLRMAEGTGDAPSFAQHGVSSSPGALQCRGLDARSGRGPLLDTRIVEPLGSKLHMVYSLVEILQQILRIDYLVPVCNHPLSTDGDQMSDSDD